jgi:hypothetical protein
MTDDIPAKTDGVASNIADDNNSTSTDNDSNIWANAPYRNYEDPINGTSQAPVIPTSPDN